MRGWSLSVCVVAASLLAACHRAPAKDARNSGPLAVEVLELTPRTEAVRVELPGRIRATVVAEVRPQVSGIVKQRHFTEGADVKAGDILYTLDAAMYQAMADQAQAAHLSAQANLEAIQAKERRYQPLTEAGAVSRQAYEDVAVALKQGIAAVAEAAAAAKIARINLEYTRVRAPIAGRIGPSMVNQGALVTANQTASLAVIQKIDEVFIDIPQSSAEFSRLQGLIRRGELSQALPGETRIRLKLEDGTVYPHTGVLKFADVTVDESTASLVLRAAFANPDLALLPGTYVRAEIAAGAYPNVLVISPRALARDPRGDASAYVVKSDDTVEQRKLSLGGQVAGGWIVQSGVQAGERLVVIGAQLPKPGATVRIVPSG